jgi:hypothetical protein
MAKKLPFAAPAGSAMFHSGVNRRPLFHRADARLPRLLRGDNVGADVPASSRSRASEGAQPAPDQFATPEANIGSSK